MIRSTAAALLLVLSSAARGDSPYEARIRRTTYGIPHIQAKDYGSLGFGEGFAQAEDHLCTVLDQVVKVRGERAKYFGAGTGDRNLYNDIAMWAFDLQAHAEQLLKSQPPELRDWWEGYVEGINRHLAQTGKDHIGGWCRSADLGNTRQAGRLGGVLGKRAPHYDNAQ